MSFSMWSKRQAEIYIEILRIEENLRYDEWDNSFELQDAGEMYELGGQIEKAAGLYITVKSYTKAHPLLDRIASPKLQIEVSGHDMKKNLQHQNFPSCKSNTTASSITKSFYIASFSMSFTRGEVILNFVVLEFSCAQYAKAMEADKKFAEAATAYELAEVTRLRIEKLNPKCSCYKFPLNLCIVSQEHLH